MTEEEFYQQTDDAMMGEIDSPEQARVCFAWMKAYAAHVNKELVKALTGIISDYKSETYTVAISREHMDRLIAAEALAKNGGGR